MTRWRITLAAAALYAVMWVGYRRHWAWVHGLDWSLLNAARDVAIKHPAWVRFWDVFTFVFGPEPLRLIGLAVAIVLLVRRRVRAALLVVACAPLNGLVTTGAKALANRPRPPTMLAYAPSTSFPSGHALETTAAWLALLTLLLPVLSLSWRRAAIAVAAVVLVLVGVSRVALNVHYPSDVLAGWALGYLYFLLCLTVFRPRSALVTAQ
ncbi:Membrane-associated phospholipid phosphatase [Mycobacterium rhizamassiliense]|uniref:Membrane-associated phospholipid phosphatase n=1 Tax=Mycobacterium rhizamassiliense TaxID=1841860 RepID=A0A2U3NP08_9MYCO|nr:phosphatase PAP2 family protein [Mycobacterium rhizamassiliense]SPM33267.1 Membrane-associated phospholipid phosphatase [Mycobacterium rhizamassiliense]